MRYIRFQQKKHFDLFPKSVDCYKKKKKKKIKIYTGQCPFIGRNTLQDEKKDEKKEIEEEKDNEKKEKEDSQYKEFKILKKH